MLSLTGLLLGLCLLIWLTMRGLNLFILAPLCALWRAKLWAGSSFYRTTLAVLQVLAFSG